MEYSVRFTSADLLYNFFFGGGGWNISSQVSANGKNPKLQGHKFHKHHFTT